MPYSANIEKLQRNFLPQDYTITTWDSLQPYFTDLQHRPLESLQALHTWLLHSSELEAAISEDACWRQIKMTCNTTNKALEDAFNYFCMHIQPQVQQCADALNHKLLNCPYTQQLDPTTYHTYLRSIRKSVALYRDVNVPIQAELAVEQQHYGTITGAMTIQYQGQEYTLQQASKLLQHQDRNVRETVYRAINDRRLQDVDKLDALMDSLLTKRNTIATNAGYGSYTQYRFKELGRFDYTVEDCQQFHQAVKEHILPLVSKIYQAKQAKLGVPTLRPWDVDAEPTGTAPLQPFTTGQELLNKTITCFEQLSPFFANCLRKMQALNHFDLESRVGKAPGGYNCPLTESGAPFIFMNAAGQMDDVITMVHEGGHAVHSFLAHNLPLSGFKEYPMEIAEVASMSMELFSMEHWDSYFTNPADLNRAKLHQLERVITIFPWIATIDKYQLWLYSHPNHTSQERNAAWQSILQEYSVPELDVTGLQQYRNTSWQRQLHLYEVPFYYIEYGIAQLGAIGMYMQYKQDKQAALSNYCKALSLGATKTLPELYQAAGLQFSFAPSVVKELIAFITQEMHSIDQA